MFPNPESLPGSSTVIWQRGKKIPRCLAILTQRLKQYITDFIHVVTVWIHVRSIQNACLFCLIDKIVNTNHKYFYLSTLQALLQVERQCTSPILRFHSLQKYSVDVPSVRALRDQNPSILSEKFHHSKKRFITPLKVGRSITSPAIVTSSHSQKEGMGNTANTGYL